MLRHDKPRDATPLKPGQPLAEELVKRLFANADGRVRPEHRETDVLGHAFRAGHFDTARRMTLRVLPCKIERTIVDIHRPHLERIRGAKRHVERDRPPTGAKVKAVAARGWIWHLIEQDARGLIEVVTAEHAVRGDHVTLFASQKGVDAFELQRSLRRFAEVVGLILRAHACDASSACPGYEVSTRERGSRAQCRAVDSGERMTNHFDDADADGLSSATEAHATDAPRRDARRDAVERVLERAAASGREPSRRFSEGRAQALSDEDAVAAGTRDDGLQLDREERAGLRRVDGLSTELEDVTEVEYRQLRLEKVVLIGVYAAGSLDDAENSLHELAALAETAGAVVLDGILQRRPHPDPATYLGRGKVEELRDIVKACGADTVVADTELAPSQRRALEDAVKVKVIDRTAVILDIFSQHAKSREGKAQVELAQLEYLLPRLRGWGESMSRQAGGQVSGGAGMGSRGPGETKIELDRRRIHSRMAKLRREIAGMKAARDTKRASRTKNLVPSVSIAGYTNAGKSSLLNRLTKAGVLVENQLFATLDATVRRTEATDGRPYTLVDTVGFVRNLPHQLVEAFRSTLEEVQYSDLIVHVVDAAHPDPAGQIRTVREVIAEIGASDIPELIVFNKCDLIDDDRVIELRGLESGAVFVSAATGEGIPELLERIESLIPAPSEHVWLMLPYSRGDVLSMLHEQGSVLELAHEESGTRVHARIHPDQLGLVDAYRVDGHAPLPEEPPLKRKPRREEAPVAEMPASLPKHDDR